ncbi:acyl carrier protein [bacterium]|nr:acyl carrier protein [bacterium]
MENTLQIEINKLIQLQLGITKISENDRLVEDLSAESADIANIVAAAEEKFQINISESEIAKIYTPLDIYRLVQAKSQ